MLHCNNKRRSCPNTTECSTVNNKWKRRPTLWTTSLRRPRRTSVYQSEAMRPQPETSEEGPVERAGSGDLAFQTTVRVIKPVRRFFLWQLQPLTNARYYFLLLSLVRVIFFRHTVHVHGYFYIHLSDIILYWLLQLATRESWSMWQPQITAYAINCFMFLSRGWLITYGICH